jgi:hypothetical protein
MQNWKEITFTLVLISVLVFSFQNCSEVAFTPSPEETSTSSSSTTEDTDDNNMAETDDDIGLFGGHFDLDTSTRFYGFNMGTTNRHVHEYDNLYDITYIDTFALKDSRLDNITEAISPNDKFILTIANAELSSGAKIVINGKSQTVSEYKKLVDAYISGQTNALSVYSLTAQTGATVLSSLRIEFVADAILNNGLLPTQPNCVIRNQPGKNGEYRNGALLVQAAALAGAELRTTLDPNLLIASTEALRWEAAIFYHKPRVSCY